MQQLTFLLSFFLIYNIIFGTSILDQPDCGKRKGFHGEMWTLRIMGGSKAYYMEFPWFVLLEMEIKSSSDFKIIKRCAGSIITTKFVLTAAHCFYLTGQNGYDTLIPIEELLRGLVVYAGITNPRLNEKYKEIHNTSQITIHPKYSSTTRNNDIALIKLEKEITLGYNSPFSPICLPGPKEEYYDYIMVAGWGLTERDERTDTLLRVVLPRITNGQCQMLYTNTIFHSNMCTYDPQHKKCPRHGDFGGPGMCLHKNDNRIYICGVASWASTNCDAPTVYTKVETYLQWIEDTVKTNYTKR